MAEARKDPGRQEAGRKRARMSRGKQGCWQEDRQTARQGGRQVGNQPRQIHPTAGYALECGKRAKMAGYGGDSCRKKSQDGRLRR